MIKKYIFTVLSIGFICVIALAACNSSSTKSLVPAGVVPIIPTSTTTLEPIATATNIAPTQKPDPTKEPEVPKTKYTTLDGGVWEIPSVEPYTVVAEDGRVGKLTSFNSMADAKYYIINVTGAMGDLSYLKARGYNPTKDLESHYMSRNNKNSTFSEVWWMRNEEKLVFWVYVSMYEDGTISLSYLGQNDSVRIITVNDTMENIQKAISSY